MKQMTVGDFKAQFSSALEQVMQGEEIQILYGRAKKPVACFSKINEAPKRKKRPLGLYEGKASYWEDESFEITPEWLFDDMDDLM
jgi:antitoxin (DNA-binding transcriptional repressor) of toxin-antitoxin stability system